MTSEMMYRYQRKSACKGQSLCKVHSYKKCTDQSRRICYRKGIYSVEVCLCLSECFLYNSVYRLTVTA